jgi:hypothetical protein
VEPKLQVFAITASGILLFIIFELLRRRRLIERYALIWLGSGIVLLVLAIWTGLLEIVSNALGIAYPPNALFAFAFAFVLLLLMHFSIAISRLSGETKVLAQEVARLDKKLREMRGDESAEADRAAAPELASRTDR